MWVLITKDHAAYREGERVRMNQYEGVKAIKDRWAIRSVEREKSVRDRRETADA